MAKTNAAVAMVSARKFAAGLRNRGTRAEHREFQVRVLRERPMREIHQPHEHGTDKGADHLRADVTGNVGPRKRTN
jgi:hypothetical protein